ncbi:hypothetical protein JG687_00017394 [Phytophthora cactorum]|uniref:PiggyBac transposable element-derived protein domain-containing protein n=2 Tax=Phytophthora cactorum TaxID=29920 RepID=A0A329SLF0_9STRA|nr:hypothetical protein Pcac1_g5793 [Phytophthora cactorum]KAG2819414.1 hypothetical protein PC111_g11913 [Phytophthora cactorum]KAG2853848.1 hypothetical protein PC113_g13815 [Phytophthora cactorum]KAG2910889.1 hypothetical protein PC115_g12758 [Phytophthora cactorum]KAG2977091.1 hypothetical protein PC118_g13079 [Phytophthora cactorum]
MGGMDVHDQLRLQRYSLQRAGRFRKYYKPLVLGLIDLAIVNGYFVHKAYHKHGTSCPLTPVKYLKRLHLQLCQLQASGMHEAINFGAHQGQEQEAPAAASVRAGQATHAPQLLDEWRDKSTQPKRRQRACKVSLLLRVGGKTTTAFCRGECSETESIFLCMKPRRQIRGSDDLLGYSVP